MLAKHLTAYAMMSPSAILILSTMYVISFESSDSSDDDQDRAAKAARATGSTTIPDVAVFQVLAFWLGDAKTL